MEDYYSILGVSPKATSEEINERFRLLAQAYHPDKFSTEKQKRQAEEEFKKFNEAYQILTNETKRLEYDRVRNPRSFKVAEEARRRAQDEKRKREEAERQRQQQVQEAQRDAHEAQRKQNQTQSKTEVKDVPVFIDGMICRIAQEGDTVFSEVWNGNKGWGRINIPLSELLKAPRASKETLLQLGIPESDWK